MTTNTTSESFLVKEQNIYVDHIEDWLSSRSHQWVWINRNKINFYGTYVEAIEDAHKQGFTKDPVFIEEIVKDYYWG